MTHLFSKSSRLKIAAPLMAGLFASAVMLPAVVSAQDLPSYAEPQAQEIQGTIQSIDGTFAISVHDNNGYVEDVELHQGTIINPTGLTLAPGMAVTILGYNGGSQFEANEIDTPYQYSGPAPTPVYYGPDNWYPGFAYGYGPSFSLVFGGGPVLVQRPWTGHSFVNVAVHEFGNYHPAPPAINVGVWARQHPFRGGLVGANFHPGQPGPNVRPGNSGPNFHPSQPSGQFRPTQPGPQFHPQPGGQQIQPTFRRPVPQEATARNVAPQARSFAPPARNVAPQGRTFATPARNVAPQARTFAPPTRSASGGADRQGGGGGSRPSGDQRHR